MSSRGRPDEDMTVIEAAGPTDLDGGRVDALLERVRQRNPSAFARTTDEESLVRLGALAETHEGFGVTLAGLLSLGIYPQQFLPQLNITFTAYPTRTGEPLEGVRFLDNVPIDGSIPSMLATLMSVLRRNMKRRAIVMGLGREDRWEYPEEVIRELVANALMHRDYHALAQGMQISVNQFPDRLEVTSPGGLFGPVNRQGLLTEHVTSSRNGRLARLLEDVQGEDGRSICENRGSGLISAVAALRQAGMEPPEIRAGAASFKVVLGNQTLLDVEALTWLESLRRKDLSDRQRLGLALLKRRGRITNEIYRTVTGCDSLTATRDLSGLADRGLVERIGASRAATWYPSAAKADVERRRGTPPPIERPRLASSSRRDRREEIERLLDAAPLSTRELAEHLALKRGAVLAWLRRLEQEGRVEVTTTNRRDPNLRWRLTCAR